MNREPLITAGSLTALVTAVLALIVSFGLDINDDTQAAILGVIAVAFPFVAPLFARSKVTPLADPRDDAGNALTADGYATDFDDTASDRGAIDAYGLGGVILAVLIVLVFLKVFGVL